MNKTLKTSLVLLLTVFALAACGQNNSAGSAAQTSQTAQETTTAPTTQANIKESDHESSDNKQSNNNLPKDGVQRFKRVDKGGSTFLIYYFKDDIVYKQIGIYFYNPKGLGKSEEEVIQLLKKVKSFIRM